MGVALGAQAVKAADYDAFRKAVWAIGDHLAATRPTAVNLFWAIDRVKRRLDALKTEPIPVIKQKLIAEAQAILAEDIAMNRAIGKHGAAGDGDGAAILPRHTAWRSSRTRTAFLSMWRRPAPPWIWRRPQVTRFRSSNATPGK